MSDFKFSIDIGSCVTKQGSDLSRLYCLDNEKFNFCCHQSNVSILLKDTGARKCCSLENYSDQHWVSLAAIQGYSMLLVPLFFYSILVMCWFYFSSYKIRHSDVQESRRYIMKQLLKHQILHKSKRLHIEPSIVHGLSNISRVLTSEEDKYKQRKAKSDEPRKPS